MRLIRGGMPETSFFRLSLDSLSAALLERGLLTEAEMEHARVGLADPSNTYLTPILVSAWGRAPSGRGLGVLSVGVLGLVSAQVAEATGAPVW